MITTDRLPATSWRSPRDIRATLELPPAGVLLGADRLLTPVVLPALAPRPTRLGVLGDQRIAALLAYRLLGVGCLLSVATADPARWRQLLTAAGSRAVVGSSTAGWPPPTTGAEESHLLVTDLSTPPPTSLGDAPMRTVVHVAGELAALPDSPFWRAVDAVVVAGRGHGAPLARALGRPDALELDLLGPGQIGVLDRSRVVAVTPILADTERVLLAGGPS